jgi:DNA-binding NtrC family response regulator
VRELQNAIEHAIVMGLTEEILPEDLPPALLEEQGDQVAGSRYHHTVNRIKKQLIVDAVRETKGSYTEAAKLLGLHPKYLHRLAKNLNLKSELRPKDED